MLTFAAEAISRNPNLLFLEGASLNPQDPTVFEDSSLPDYKKDFLIIVQFSLALNVSHVNIQTFKGVFPRLPSPGPGAAVPSKNGCT
jgi:hypothetical protein